MCWLNGLGALSCTAEKSIKSLLMRHPQFRWLACLATLVMVIIVGVGCTQTPTKSVANSASSYSSIAAYPGTRVLQQSNVSGCKQVYYAADIPGVSSETLAAFYKAQFKQRQWDIIEDSVEAGLGLVIRATAGGRVIFIRISSNTSTDDSVNKKPYTGRVIFQQECT